MSGPRLSYTVVARRCGQWLAAAVLVFLGCGDAPPRDSRDSHGADGARSAADAATVAPTDPGATASATAAAGRRNSVLVLVPDTVRADHLGVNGYPLRTTPRLDALAAEGVNFRNAITVAPRTWQSFSSILTGVVPPVHGVRYLYDHPLRPDTPTIASFLREYGYETLSFDPSPFVEDMAPDSGFDEHRHARKGRVSGMGAQREADEETLIGRVLRRMNKRGDAPFFYFVRVSGPHWPYNTNEWTPLFAQCEGHDHTFNEGTYGRSMQQPGEGAKIFDLEGHRHSFWSREVGPESFDHMIAHYDGKLRFTDELFGRLFDRMREAGLLERTLVAVVSDHGESFGGHDYWQHGPRVDDAVLRVPLILRLPEGHPDRVEGLQIDAQVRVIDLFPTIADALGLPAPAGLDGRSLMPLVRGKPDAERWAYSEAGRSLPGVDPERYVAGVAGKQRSIRTSSWKLLFVPRPDFADGGEYRLFDLQSDPGESRDVAAEHPAVVEELRAHLAAVQDREEPDESERRIEQREVELLRELGYVE